MHSPTLIAIMSILSAIMALTQTTVWFFNRQIPGLAAWAIAYWCALFSSINFLMRPPDAGIAWVLSLQAAQFLVGALIYKGIRDYLGLKPARLGWGAAALAILLGATVYYTIWEPDPGSRIVASSLITAWLFGLSAFTLLDRNLLHSPARILVAIPCLFHAGFAIARIFIIQKHLPAMQAFDPSTLPPIIIIETMTVLVVTSFGTLILANDYITRELRWMAERDALTGTCNRRTFLTLLGKALSIAKRRKYPLSVLLIDLDHFKRINDNWGHKQGDAALAHFVEVTMTCLRKEDILGRLGGEEFAIFLPDTGLKGASVVAERLRSLVAATPMETATGKIQLTVSIGVVQCVIGQESSDEILHRADSAMYLAKQNGRNRIETDEFVPASA